MSLQDSVSQETPMKRAKRNLTPELREKNRIYMANFMALYRADEESAKEAGFLTVGAWRKAGRPIPKSE